MYGIKRKHPDPYHTMSYGKAVPPAHGLNAAHANYLQYQQQYYQYWARNYAAMANQSVNNNYARPQSSGKSDEKFNPPAYF